jgi:hypothetical protein
MKYHTYERLLLTSCTRYRRVIIFRRLHFLLGKSPQYLFDRTDEPQICLRGSETRTQMSSLRKYEGKSISKLQMYIELNQIRVLI